MADPNEDASILKKGDLEEEEFESPAFSALEADF
jgi:chromosome segregation ATPase